MKRRTVHRKSIVFAKVENFVFPNTDFKNSRPSPPAPPSSLKVGRSLLTQASRPTLSSSGSAGGEGTPFRVQGRRCLVSFVVSFWFIFPVSFDVLSCVCPDSLLFLQILLINPQGFRRVARGPGSPTLSSDGSAGGWAEPREHRPLAVNMTSPSATCDSHVMVDVVCRAVVINDCR